MKRTADKLVSSGRDIPDAHELYKALKETSTTVKLFYVETPAVEPDSPSAIHNENPPSGHIYARNNPLPGSQLHVFHTKSVEMSLHYTALHF